MNRLFLLLSFAFVPCVSSKAGPGQVDRICTIYKSHGKLKVTGISKSFEAVTKFSFTIPDKEIISFEYISNYSQQTKNKDGSGWSGGGPSAGFIFISRSFEPHFLELHLLQKSDCSCRHNESYFANGRYLIKAEQGAAANP